MTHPALDLERPHPRTGAAIGWKRFGDLPGFTYKILNVDADRNEIDMVFWFEPNGVCFHHRHKTRVTSIVLEGEHVVREYDSAGNERVSVRPTGQYTMSDGGDAHIEGGGENGAMVLFNFRGDGPHIYDIMDEQLNVVREVHIADFQRAFDEW